MALTIKTKAGTSVTTPVPKKRARHDWTLLRQRWLTENMQPEREHQYTVRDFSQDINISYDRIAQVAARDSWYNALKALKEESNMQLHRQLIAKVGTTEIEIRTKQAEYAQLAMDKAIIRLRAVNPLDLTIKQATALLQLGLTEERRAYGMVESTTMLKTPPVEQEIPMQQVVHRSLQLIQTAREKNKLRLVNDTD